jgi:Ankyrin repeats (many copies)
MQMMLPEGWPVDAQQANDGATALHWAAWHGDSRMVTELLRHGPQLELRDGEFGKTPLEWAMHGSLHGWCRDAGDYPAVVSKLLQAGAQTPKLVHPGHASDAVLNLVRPSEGTRHSS